MIIAETDARTFPIDMVNALLHNNNLILAIKGENPQPAHVNQQFEIRLDEIEDFLC